MNECKVLALHFSELGMQGVVCGMSTVARTKRRFVEGNLELALSEARRSGAARKLTVSD